jgi:fructose-specific phosphotransferase system IIC component
VKTILTTLMTMEYVRVRKSTMKELKTMLEKRSSADWHIVAAIVGVVMVIAITGLALSL